MQKLFKYRYILLFSFFGLWMLFFDSNNAFYRFSIAAEVSDLEDSKVLFVQEIADLRRQRTELLGNQANLEKFAREKYMMKKDNEDLFVIINDTLAEDWMHEIFVHKTQNIVHFYSVNLNTFAPSTRKNTLLWSL